MLGLLCVGFGVFLVRRDEGIVLEFRGFFSEFKIQGILSNKKVRQNVQL